MQRINVLTCRIADPDLPGRLPADGAAVGRPGSTPRVLRLRSGRPLPVSSHATPHLDRGLDRRRPTWPSKGCVSMWAWRPTRAPPSEDAVDRWKSFCNRVPDDQRRQDAHSCTIEWPTNLRGAAGHVGNQHHRLRHLPLPSSPTGHEGDSALAQAPPRGQHLAISSAKSRVGTNWLGSAHTKPARAVCISSALTGSTRARLRQLIHRSVRVRKVWPLFVPAGRRPPL